MLALIVGSATGVLAFIAGCALGYFFGQSSKSKQHKSFIEEHSCEVRQQVDNNMRCLLQKLRVEDLKLILKQQKLPISGLKQNIVERVITGLKKSAAMDLVD